jgi:hypothetical protein
LRPRTLGSTLYDMMTKCDIAAKRPRGGVCGVCGAKGVKVGDPSSHKHRGEPGSALDADGNAVAYAGHVVCDWADRPSGERLAVNFRQVPVGETWHQRRGPDGTLQWQYP